MCCRGIHQLIVVFFLQSLQRGMMQLTADKCKGANCYDASTNIMLGAKFFKSRVSNFNGNVLAAVGDYNGWSTRMSYSSATNPNIAACAHQNLDYVSSRMSVDHASLAKCMLSFSLTLSSTAGSWERTATLSNSSHTTIWPTVQDDALLARPIPF